MVEESEEMSSRDLLYRSVLRGGQSDCPQLSSDLSPMSNLALSLHHGASLSETPRRRLSLSSNMTDTPQSCHDTSSLHSTSLLHDSHISDPGSSQGEESPISPSRRLSSRDKENFPSPYYSPSRSTIPPRSRASPLQDVQNTVNRNLSPLKKNLQLVSPSKRVLTSPHKPSPPDDCDTNSQDSGYSESSKKLDVDCFSVPVSCAPRKLNLDLSPPKPLPIISPVKSVAIISSPVTVFSTATSTPITSSHDSTEGRKPFRKFSSLSKGDEEDTMLMDLMNEMNTQEDEPLGLSKLLSAPIQPSAAPTSSQSQVPPRSIFEGRPSIRRCLSMIDTTPTSSRVQSISGAQAVQASTAAVSFKRPQPPTDLSNGMECKRRKQDDSSDQLSPITFSASTTTGEKNRAPLVQKQVSAPEVTTTQVIKPKIQRSHSESHVSIMKALNKSSGHDGNLIGDFSKSVLLPTVEGAKHPDLKSVSVDTVAQVVRGEYSSKVASFRIIDCRYPYEFEGGHIIGAEMWHHPKLVEEYLQAKKGAPVITSEEASREILIFHCEFSAERGPKTQRLLREMDRAINKEHYPALHFPEMYLLEGGYKAFFEKYPELCIPKKYVRMLDSKHAEDLKHFRGKSKSWAAENKQSKSRNALPRPGLKRLGL
ncbi:M-phase inducer phosphatase-like isoform X2 [Panulirus ornatus]|uniref:M-phase inducer phosphatase-like isoform X2 n=1 Tax=Panulirus ornatus TaxID=150431 RepID=UPI003A8BC7FA